MLDFGYNIGVVPNKIVGRSGVTSTLRPEQVLEGELTMSHSIPNTSALKVCLKCGEPKPSTEYSKNQRRKDGLQAYCKACQSAFRAERYWEDAEYRERQRAQWREYRSRPEVQRAKNEWDKNNGDAEKKLARAIINTHVRRGKLPPAKTMVCSVCDEALADHWHHHKGYDRANRLDVVPVCRDCHGREHWRQSLDK
jgi:hypothetical protein